MEQTETTQNDIPEKKTLIDFLYIDKEKIDSLISQLHEGTLRSVKRTNGTSQSSSDLQERYTEGSGSGGLPAIANGSFKGSHKSANMKSGKTNNCFEENYDPYHSIILNLLTDLDIYVITDIPEPQNPSQLVLIESQIIIRNFEILQKTIPLMKKKPKLFGLNTNKNSSDYQFFDMLSSFIELMPLSTDLELILKNGQSITGALKESNLLTKFDDILRSTGNILPGTWYTLGIIDQTPNNCIISTEFNNFKTAMDAMYSAIRDMYSPPSICITPILIFRNITT